MIKSCILDNAGKVKLITNGKEGNALIAVKDADNTILWSWHIWMTDQPADQNYENDVLGSFVMLDRNIGAIRADRGTGDEWKEASGLQYQWGRKDPFAPGKFTDHSGQFTAAESLKYPTEFGTSSNWTSETQVNFWNAGKKTIYDPCPVGYRVPMENVWYGFSSEGSSNYVTESQVSSTTYDNGWSFYRNSSSETAWYPVTGYYYYGINSYSNSSYGYYWSADKNGGGNPYYIHFRSDRYVCQNETTNTRDACNIRCLKDEDHVDISTHVSFKPVEFSEVSTSSVKLSSGYKEGSAVTIVEKGFAYDKSADFSNETRVAVESDGRDFLCTLTDLDNATLYYVRAYAETVIGNETVMFYSDAITFGTRYSEDVVNLSERGTANCYIVSYPGAYSFNCTVKGNSTESVGVVSTLEVLWESDSYMTKAATGTIVSSVTLYNNAAVISLPDDFNEGSALIAAKDENGTILWSWHIWITDTPVDHNYVNGDTHYIVQDRNLGAARGDHGYGDEWKQSCGLTYVWGRKDPFSAGNYTVSVSTSSTEDHISNPMVIYLNWNSSGWDAGSKTLNDPCPVGYRVATREVYACLQASGDYNNGWNYLYDGENTSWYPVKSEPYADGSIRYWGDCYMWHSSNNLYCFYFGSDTSTNLNQSVGTHNLAIRCMKDE